MTRYNILNPNITKEKDGSPMDEKKASGNLLDESKLDVSLFRLGHTKARVLSFTFLPLQKKKNRILEADMPLPC
jgi:myosin heavy subunit